MTPNILDLLDEQYRRFDSHPEVRWTDEGVLLKKGAYLAFLEARKLIEPLRLELYSAIKGWRPIATFFETELETPMVLLWDGEIHCGYWDDDEQSWYLEGQGPDLESSQLNPSKWMPLGEVTMMASEYVVVERMK